MSKKTGAKNTPKRPVEQSIAFAVANIEVVESKNSIPEGFEPQSGDTIKYNLRVELSQQDKIMLKLRITSIINVKDVPMFTIVVDNVFAIQNLSNLIVNNKFTDRNFIKYIAEMSVSHARGIHATLIKNTVLHKVLIPMIELDNITNEVRG